MSVDVVFTGGPVFLGEGQPENGLAVAVTGNRITAIVPEAEAGALAGPDTRRVDLDGALLSPGFQDAHVHPIGAGIELLQCNLTEATSAEEALETIAQYATSHPDEGWILGGGWSMEHYPGGTPTRQMLDAIVSDRPVFLSNRDHHGGWANTRAIELAGIDANTADPESGRIEREADGYPAGTFHEGAMDLFDRVKPVVDADFAYHGLLRAQDELISLGITGWQDAWLGKGSAGADPELYERAVAEGKLHVHVVGAQWWERERGLEQIDEKIAARDRLAAGKSPERFNLGAVKLMVDGVAENYTALMLEPYLDGRGHATCNHGISFIDAETLREAAIRLDAAGMQLHFHALGDRAVRDALDAVEAARAANGPGDGRHHLAHLQMVSAEDTPRFADVDAIANIQALWATHEEQLDVLALPFLPEGAKDRHYPFGELHRAGARLAAGSDWPVSSADPLAAIAIAVNRRYSGSDLPPLGGTGQRLDLETAFAAYTSGSAFVNHREHDTGAVREGYLANFAVISPNPFELPPEHIEEASVTSTWIEGEEVYSAGE